MKLRLMWMLGIIKQEQQTYILFRYGLYRLSADYEDGLWYISNQVKNSLSDLKGVYRESGWNETVLSKVTCVKRKEAIIQTNMITSFLYLVR